MSRRHSKFRRRRPGAPHSHERISLTPDGVPAAVPDAPPVSRVVLVAAESREKYPWLPARVIAWSVWHGPAHVRVQIDEDGNAVERGVRPPLPRVA
jgi:hypothetical protein